MEKQVLNTEEAAAFLSLSPLILRRHARNGVIPGQKVGRRWAFDKARLVEWLRSGGPQVSMDVDKSPWGK